MARWRREEEGGGRREDGGGLGGARRDGGGGLAGGRRVDVVTSTVTPMKSVGGADVYSNKMSSQETV